MLAPFLQRQGQSWARLFVAEDNPVRSYHIRPLVPTLTSAPHLDRRRFTVERWDRSTFHRIVRMISSLVVAEDNHDYSDRMT